MVNNKIQLDSNNVSSTQPKARSFEKHTFDMLKTAFPDVYYFNYEPGL